MQLSLLLFALSIGVAAQTSSKTLPQHVYGDRVTKKYYSIECEEVAAMDPADMQGFKSPIAAEKAGFVKGEKCSEPRPKGSSVQFFGDRSRKEFYAAPCPTAASLSSQDWIVFENRHEAEKQGYKISPCPIVPQPVARMAPKGRSVPMKRVPLPRVIAITSEPSEWLGKLVTVEADVHITDSWGYDENTYSFRITDGSAGFYLYMEKKSAQALRQLILKQPAADGVYGQFTFFLNPVAYLRRGELYGRLVSYRVQAE